MNKDSFEKIYGKVYINTSGKYPRGSKSTDQEINLNDFLKEFFVLKTLSEDDYSAYDTVQKYKNDLTIFFDNQKELFTSFYAGKEHAHTISLEKKRLSRLGIRKHYKEFLSLSSQETTPCEITYTTKGAGKVNCVNETISSELLYLRTDASAIADLETEQIDSFYVKHPVSYTTKEIICPSCGHKQPFDSEKKCCTNCHFDFNDPALQFKVLQHNDSSFYAKPNPLASGIKVWKTLWFIAFTLLILNFIFPLTGHWIIFLLLGIPVNLFAIISFVMLTIASCKSAQTKRLQKKAICESFTSMNEFLATTSNKIYSLHYADSPEDVSFFVKCNIEPFLAQCKNIFDCGLGHFRIASFQSDSQYYYITFQRSVSFFRYIDNTAVGETHLVELELIKKINASFKSDYIMSRCPSLLCNEPFDWLSGQTCPNCGEKPAYEEYDWAVTNARIIPFKNKQEQNMWF